MDAAAKPSAIPWIKHLSEASIDSRVENDSQCAFSTCRRTYRKLQRHFMERVAENSIFGTRVGGSYGMSAGKLEA